MFLNLVVWKQRRNVCINFTNVSQITQREIILNRYEYQCLVVITNLFVTVSNERKLAAAINFSGFNYEVCFI